MIEILINYWYIIVAVIAILAIAGYKLYKFFKTPSNEQLKEVKEWLLYAVMEAEKQLGSGTGELKLRYVYDLFLARFPFLTALIPFDLFSKLVDEALDKFKALLSTNEKVQEYVDKAS